MKELLFLIFISIFLTLGSTSNHSTSDVPTENITTPVSTNTTTNIPKTTTPKLVPTTTAAPGPSNFTFGNCLALFAAISIVGKSESVNVPAKAATNGSCGKGNASLIITWSNNSINFNFVNNNGTAYLEEVAIKLANISENKIVHVKLSSDKTFYTCPETVLSLKDYNVSLVALKVQAFNYNTSFSGDGEHCGAVTTATPMTTHLPSTTFKPTPVPSLVTDKYAVNGTNVTCLLMFAAIKFNIPYIGKKNATYTGVIGKSPDYEGTCGVTTDTLKITVGDIIILEFTFMDKNGSYSLYQLKLTANTKHFPGGKGNIITANYTNHNTFQLKVGESYYCKSKTTLHLSSDVDVFITDLRLEAFRNSASQDIGGTMVICPGDQKTNSIVPIAVGAALAALVVIVLIAYLIGRKRSRKGYESV